MGVYVRSHRLSHFHTVSMRTLLGAGILPSRRGHYPRQEGQRQEGK